MGLLLEEIMSETKERKESFSECEEAKCTSNLNEDGSLSTYIRRECWKSGSGVN